MPTTSDIRNKMAIRSSFNFSDQSEFNTPEEYTRYEIERYSEFVELRFQEIQRLLEAAGTSSTGTTSDLTLLTVRVAALETKVTSLEARVTDLENMLYGPINGFTGVHP